MEQKSSYKETHRSLWPHTISQHATVNKCHRNAADGLHKLRGIHQEGGENGYLSSQSPSQNMSHLWCKVQTTGGPETLDFSPVKLVKVTNATAILGLEFAGMHGRMVQSKPDWVETDNVVPILRDFYGLHKFAVLTADVMCANGIAFLTTLLRKIRVFTLEHVKSHTAAQLNRSLNK